MNDNNPPTSRLQLKLSKQEIEAIDKWRYVRRMPSRAAAVRELLRIALNASSSTVDGST